MRNGQWASNMLLIFTRQWALLIIYLTCIQVRYEHHHHKERYEHHHHKDRTISRGFISIKHEKFLKRTSCMNQELRTWHNIGNKKFFLQELDEFWVFDYGNARDVLLVLGFKTFLRTNILSVILFNDIFPDKCLFWYLSCTKLTFSYFFQCRFIWFLSVGGPHVRFYLYRTQLAWDSKLMLYCR